MEKQKKVSTITLALLLFIAVFGLSNVPNNYSQLGNTTIGWFIVLGFYFIPLALIMAELGAFNTKSNSGMSGWIKIGLGESWGFIGAWTYFIANIFYIPMLASRVPIMLSWTFTSKFNALSEVVTSNGMIDGVVNATNNRALFLILAFVVVIVALIAGIFFEKIFNALGSIVGWLSLLITILFILLALLTVPVLSQAIANPITISSIIPRFTPTAISTFAWILFAIAGIETVGSYVGRIQDPKRKLPRGIVLAALMVSFAYIIGFAATAFILTPDQLSQVNLENMIQVVYAQAGEAWGLGPIYLRLVMFALSTISITAVVLWLISTVSVLFDDLPKGVISEKIRSKKINGIPLFGILFTGAMILIFLIVSNSGASANIYSTLYDMSTMAVLLPYLLVVLSYIAFKHKNMQSGYQVTKNKYVAFAIAIFVLIVTIVAVVFSTYDLTLEAGKERMSWLLLSGGGTLFFISIGVAIYLRKINVNYSFAALVGLFTLASILFSNLLFIFVTLIIIMWIYNYILIKKTT